MRKETLKIPKRRGGVAAPSLGLTGITGLTGIIEEFDYSAPSMEA